MTLEGQTASAVEEQRGVVVQLLLPFADHLRQRFGDDALHAVGQRLGVDLGALLVQPQALVSLRFIEDFCTEVARFDPDPQLFFHLGRRSWSPAYMGDHWMLMKLGGTVQLAYEGLFQDIELFNAIGRFEVLERRHGFFRLAYVPRPGAPRERVPHVCAARQGQLASVPTIFEAPLAAVTSVRCMADGDEVCEYTLSFDTGAEVLPSPRTQAALLEVRALVRDTIFGFYAQRQRLEADKAAVDAMVAQRTRELSETTARLEEALHELRLRESARTHFMLGVSHDLRSPLQAITLVTDELRSLIPDGPDAHELVEAVQLNTQRLSQLSTQLEELGLLSMGRTRSPPRSLRLGEVVDGVAAAYQTVARLRGQRLVVRHRSASLPTLGDPARLDAALTNLVTNALRVSPDKGEVRIELQETAEQLRVSVSDQGPGVPPELRDRLFEPFVQGDRRSPTVGNLGLGLAIVQSVAVQHGGEVILEPQRAVGTTFTLRLPRRAPPDLRLEEDSLLPGASVARALHPDLAPSPPIQTRWTGPAEGGPAVLIVEDNPELGQRLGQLLAAIGPVTLVESAEAALASLAEDAPRLVISDVGLPGADGLSLTRELRARLGDQVAILLVTARQSSEDVLAGFAAGADDYLFKPFRPRELLARVAVQRRHLRA